MKTIEEIEQDIIDEFGMFEDWQQKYEYIIELGHDLPLIDEKYKTDDRLIKGCQSRVWLHAEGLEDGRVRFTADSDAIITKGIISLLIRVLSVQKAEDIANAKMGFINEIGLTDHLSPTRSNGLVSMIKQMKMYAVAIKAKG